MEIHELNTFVGTLGAGDFFATDNGNDTSKISADAMFTPLNERIDNIIAGPAPSAQEVTDARRGADGTVYASLGDAIRTQFDNIESDLSEFEELTLYPNKETSLFRKEVGFINESGSTGIYQTTNSNARSLIVPCKAGSTYIVKKVASARFKVGFSESYPVNSGALTNIAVGSSTTTSLTATAGANSRYMVIFYYLATADTLTESAIYNSISVAGDFISAVDRYAREIKIFNRSEGLIYPEAYSGISVSDLEANSIYAINYTITAANITDLPRYGENATLMVYEPYHPNVATKGFRCYLYVYGNGSGTKAGAFISFQYANAGHTPWMPLAGYGNSGLPLVVSPVGPYKTITSAVASANDGDTILIMGGTYNEKIDARAKTLHFVGIDRDSVIVKDTSGDYNTPPFELASGSIRNLTIIETGEDTAGIISTKAYCIHNDFTENEGATFICDNVRMINNCHACFGAGLRDGTTMIIRNCDIYTSHEDGSTSRGALYCHTYASGSQGASKLILENNTIRSDTEYAAVLQVVSNSTVKMDCELIRNTLVASNSIANDIVDNGAGSAVTFSNPQLTKNIISNGNNVNSMNN